MQGGDTSGDDRPSGVATILTFDSLSSVLRDVVGHEHVFENTRAAQQRAEDLVLRMQLQSVKNLDRDKWYTLHHIHYSKGVLMSPHTMVRKQVYITPSQNEALAERARLSGRSQSELIREAIDLITSEQQRQVRRRTVQQVAGLWKDRNDLPDIEALRREGDVRLDHRQNKPG